MALLYLFLSAGTLVQASSPCQYKPSVNATSHNFPGSGTTSQSGLYDLKILSEVPVATVCNSDDPNRDISCARGYIDAIDEQIAFLYARRLGYAAVAGFAKYRLGEALSNPTRNQVVAEGMSQRVIKYGGSEEAGRILAGEGCQIYASLEFERQQIQARCDSDFDEPVCRVCEE
ncbi:hypothetical protein F66182_6076 [Fusarium sp. NRRL 66182]|nr:hypothetical protein F66182_6076 [Fusarium sp. NRRL 66182]